MTLLRANCPRCNTANSTFDVKAQNSLGVVEAGWIERFELFSVCRHCHKATTFVADNKKYELSSKLSDPGGIIKFSGYVNDFMNLRGYISIKDEFIHKSPDFVPKNIADVFNEGSTCVAIECFNAGGSMFRAAIDLATKGLLPPEDEPEPSKKVRRSLGLRLQWLFNNQRLPPELHELAEAVQQDGNDGAHDATLTKTDALDLEDFTYQLLERLYTVPGRVEAARERRLARRAADV